MELIEPNVYSLEGCNSKTIWVMDLNFDMLFSKVLTIDFRIWCAPNLIVCSYVNQYNKYTHIIYLHTYIYKAPWVLSFQLFALQFPTNFMVILWTLTAIQNGDNVIYHSTFANGHSKQYIHAHIIYLKNVKAIN